MMSPAGRPSSRNDIWLGDLLDAAHSLGADAEATREMASLLGLADHAPTAAPADRRPEAPPPRPPQPRQDEAPPPPEADAAGQSRNGSDADAHRLPSLAERLPGVPAPPPPWLGTTAPLRVGDAAGRLVRAPALLPPLRRRAILGAALGTPVEDGPPDVARIVAHLARGLPLRRLPRQRRRSLRHGVEVRIDRAAWLRTFADDQLALLADLRRLLPPERVRVVTTEGGPLPPPPRAQRRRRGSAATTTQSLGAPAPVLFLSDLGLHYRWQDAPPAPLAQWRRFVQAAVRQRRPVLALVPGDPARLPALPGLGLLRWSERCTVGEALRARNGQRPLPAGRPPDPADIEHLAAWLSPALRVTPWLLRAARRRLGLDVDAEAALCGSAFVQSQGAGGLLLVPEAAQRLRGQLPLAECEAALALVRKARGTARDGAAVEEALIELELRHGQELSAAQVEDVLRPALTALAAGGEAAAAVAPWAAHAWTRFSPAVHSAPAARQLAYAAASRLQTRAWLASPGQLPALPAGSDWLFVGGEVETVELSAELRRYGDGSVNLVLGPPQPVTTALHRIRLPRLDPLWLEVVVSHEAQTVLVEPQGTTQVDLGRIEAGQAVELRPLLGDGWRLVWPEWLVDAVQGAVLDGAIGPDRDPWVAVILAPDTVLLLARSSANAEPHRAPPGLELELTARWSHGVLKVRVLGSVREGMVAVPEPQLLPAWVQPLDLDAHPPLPAAMQVVFLEPGMASRKGAWLVNAEPTSPCLLLAQDFQWQVLAGAGHLAQVRQVLEAARVLVQSRPEALLLATPGAEKEAFTLWDELVVRLGSGPVVHDHDGRILASPEVLEGVLARSGRVIVVGSRAPDERTVHALQRALALDLPLLWLPLVDPGPAREALLHWPGPIAEVLQRQQWLLGDDVKELANRLAQLSQPANMAPDVRQAQAAAPAPGSLRSRIRQRLAEMLESRVSNEAQRGLFRVVLDPEPTLQRPTALPSGDRPLLLLIHGEASDTLSSFGDLLRPPGEERDILASLYGEGLLAWQYRSVTVGPLANTLALAQALPTGARLHLLTLGAGGLLGELLARGERSDGEAAFSQQEIDERLHAPQASEPDEARLMQELSQVLAQRRLRIERFVRVACPVAGAPVFSRGLARWAELMGSLVPGGGALLSFTGIDRLPSDPQAAPGLAALVPGAGVQRWLTPAVRTRAALAVVAGVSEPDGVLRRLGAWAGRLLGIDAGDGDLIVPLGSAFGGLEREDGADFFVVRGDGIDHFAFFRHDAARRAIVAALLASSRPPPRFERARSLAALQARFRTPG